MSFKEMILKQKGKWLINHTDNYKVVIDLDNMLYDTYDWYKAYGMVEQELTEEIIDELFKNTTECKRLK